MEHFSECYSLVLTSIPLLKFQLTLTLSENHLQHIWLFRTLTHQWSQAWWQWFASWWYCSCLSFGKYYRSNWQNTLYCLLVFKWLYVWDNDRMRTLETLFRDVIECVWLISGLFWGFNIAWCQFKRWTKGRRWAEGGSPLYWCMMCAEVTYNTPFFHFLFKPCLHCI